MRASEGRELGPGVGTGSARWGTAVFYGFYTGTLPAIGLFRYQDGAPGQVYRRSFSPALKSPVTVSSFNISVTIASSHP